MLGDMITCVDDEHFLWYNLLIDNAIGFHTFWVANGICSVFQTVSAGQFEVDLIRCKNGMQTGYI